MQSFRTCFFVYLASFAKHYDCGIFGCCAIYLQLVHFYCSFVFHCVNIVTFCDGYWNYFEFWAVMNNAAVTDFIILEHLCMHFFWNITCSAVARCAFQFSRS